MNKPRALVVDDEPDICELLAITLERMDIAADTCGDVRGGPAETAPAPITSCA